MGLYFCIYTLRKFDNLKFKVSQLLGDWSDLRDSVRGENEIEERCRHGSTEANCGCQTDGGLGRQCGEEP